MKALLIDVESGERISAIDQLERLLAILERHGKRLGCARELAASRRLVATGGASRQLAHARDGDLRSMTAGLARVYSSNLPVEVGDAVEPAPRAA
jgi:gamma-glutamyl:cysteine ligase YbdK (ATP-grasp superfamily)